MSTKEELENILCPLINIENYELVELQYRREKEGWVLRIFVDKPNGVTLDDCTKLSEKIGRFLDEKNLIPQRYILEVSSPGLDRPLKKESDFQKFSGRLVKITLYAPQDGQRHFVGRLRGINEGKVNLEIFSEKEISLRRIEIPLENIASARLEIEL